MNFKLNALLAAALLAAAGSANAVIDNGQPVASGGLSGVSGQGEMFIVVNDSTAAYSFVGDLGVSMDTFLATDQVSRNFNMNSFNSWTPFLSAIGGNLSNATYAVYAFDNIGDVFTGDDVKRLLTTIAAGDDVANYTTTNSKLGGAVGGNIADTWLIKGAHDDVDNNLNDNDTLANGSSYSNKFAYAEARIGDSLQANTQFVTWVAAADAADFWMLGNDGTNVVGQSNIYKQAGQFTLNADNLVYAAIPEAETYAMMLAGLGLVGFMVRRRQA